MIELRVKVRVEPASGDDQNRVEGVVVDPDGRETPFAGWLEMLAAIEGAAIAPAR